MYEFRVQCSKLKSSVLVSGIPNTFIRCQLKTSGENEDWTELKAGDGIDPEVIKHTDEPAFSRAFPLRNVAQKTQLIRFSVYETTSATIFKFKEKYFLGEIECTLEQLLASNPYSRRLMHSFKDKSFARSGIITIFTDDLVNCEKMCHFKFSAVGLDDKDTISVSDPYLEVYKRLKNDLWELLYRTEVIVNTLNPQWSEFFLMSKVLTNNNFTNEIKFMIWDYDDDGKHDFIGESVVSVDQLLKSSVSKLELMCINQHKKFRKIEGYKDSGTLIMEFCKVVDGDNSGECTKL